MNKDKVLAEAPLEFAGETSTYTGKIPLTREKATELQVLAMQPETANFGWAKRFFKN